MHNTILGIIALVSSVFCFVSKKTIAGVGFFVIALVLGFSFLILIKTLPVDIIGVTLTLLFAFGCFMILYELKETT